MMPIENQIYTLEEFGAIAHLPENAKKIFELIEGVIVEKIISNPFAPTLTQKIALAMIFHSMAEGLGIVTAETNGYIISEINMFVPDVAFISHERYSKLRREGYNPFAPDLAVEVISTADAHKDIAGKVHTYLQNATCMVWVFELEVETTTVYTSAGQHTLHNTDTLTGGDVLPGFTLSLK
jgi:Uma2 family endonuclease